MVFPWATRIALLPAKLVANGRHENPMFFVKLLITIKFLVTIMAQAQGMKI
jgi:hypothetical protein